MIWYYIREVKKFFRRMFCSDVIKVWPGWGCLRKNGAACNGMCPKKDKACNVR